MWEEFLVAFAGTTKPPLIRRASPWSELISREDWWAIWLGCGLIAAAVLLFVNGGSIKWLAVATQKWSHLPDVLTQLQQNGLRYGALFALWALLFGLGLAALGINLTAFLPAFLVLFVVAAALYFLGLWDQSARYNLEPPLVALAPGILVSNSDGVPHCLTPALPTQSSS